MKTRTGFVSNSSSSSFVVLVGDNYKTRTDTDTATEEDIKKLLNYGFHFSRIQHASKLEAGVIDRCIPAVATSLTFSVTCNEDEVALFLLQNDIPFHAACHYGHYHLFYRRGDDYMLNVPNLGCGYETYGAYPKYSHEELNDLMYPNRDEYKEDKAIYISETEEIFDEAETGLCSEQ